MIPRIDTTAAKPASIAERILAGDLSDCPEYYSDEEWRREAQACLDCEDDGPLIDMIAEGRMHDAHDAWWRSARNEREADRRQFVGIEEGPFGYDFDKLSRPPLSSFADIGEGARHPFKPSQVAA